MKPEMKLPGKQQSNEVKWEIGKVWIIEAIRGIVRFFITCLYLALYEKTLKIKVEEVTKVYSVLEFQILAGNAFWGMICFILF